MEPASPRLWQPGTRTPAVRASEQHHRWSERRREKEEVIELKENSFMVIPKQVETAPIINSMGLQWKLWTEQGVPKI